MNTKELIVMEFIKILFSKEYIHQIMGNQITIKQQKLHKLDSIKYECYILHEKLTLAFNCFICIFECQIVWIHSGDYQKVIFGIDSNNMFSGPKAKHIFILKTGIIH